MIKAIISDFNYTLFIPGDPGSSTTFSGFTLNENLFDFFRELKDDGIRIYVLTGGMIAGSPEVQEIIGDVIEDVYYTSKLGLTKGHSEIYPQILSIIKTKPEETIFIDDTPTNIEAAKQSGLHTVVYTSATQTQFEIKNILG